MIGSHEHKLKKAVKEGNLSLEGDKSVDKFSKSNIVGDP